MAFQWMRNPWHTVPLVWELSLLAVIGVGIFQFLNPSSSLSFFLALPFAIFTATFGANIGMWLYSNIQDSKWRFENIYGPLYEDTLQVLANLRLYGNSWLQKWYAMKNSSLGPFIEPRIARALDELNSALQELQTAHRLAWTSADQSITNVLTELGTLEDQRRVVANIVNLIHQDFRFVFDPAVREPSSDVVDRIRGILQESNRPATDESINDFLSRAKTALLNNAEIARHTRTIDEIRPRAETLHAEILDRVKRPIP